MPIPIKPVHSLDLHAELFDGPSMEGLGLSDIQIQLLGVNSQPKKEAMKLSNKYIDMLKQIDSNADEVVTAASQMTVNSEIKYCNVPNQINDNDLFALKTSGLIKGYGRSVELTQKAKLALRDHYLSQETVNEFRKVRTKDRFDLEEARSVKASSNKFVKTSKWLTSNEHQSFDGKLQIRFIAKNDSSRSKGLMNAKPLDKKEVAFFIFDTPDNYCFWNKNVDFDLSLAFLDKDYKILEIKDMEAQSEKSCCPKSNNVKFVVEANKGTFEDLGIKIGNSFVLKDQNLILDKTI